MEVKVRTYKLISDYYDSIKGTCYKKIYTGQFGEINIFWDETMYVNYGCGFQKNIHNLFFKKYNRLPITEETCSTLEYELNNLLRRYRETKDLFVESDLFFVPKESMIKLEKEQNFKLY